VWWLKRRARLMNARVLAAGMEAHGGLRRGSLVGIAGDDPVRGSDALTALADRRASDWLTQHGSGALEPVRRRESRFVRSGVAVAAVGAVLFAVTKPTSGRAAAF